MKGHLKLKHTCGDKLRVLQYQYQTPINAEKRIHTTIPTKYLYCPKCDSICIAHIEDLRI